MVIAALKSLTWATVAGAVVSAGLLAYGGINVPRFAGVGAGAESTRARPASTASPALTQGAQATAARHADTIAREPAPR